METRGTTVRPENDIYTVLIVIATIFVVAATIFTWVRSQSFFGTWLPLGGSLSG